ncbi:MAG TPA: hypothetical protein VNJ05_05415 [Sphingomicrobium sp.]|nr:hypothetical protein [Sphingomicrobium sp.]
MARLAHAPLFLIFVPASAWAQSSDNYGTSLQRALQSERSPAFSRDFTIGDSGWQEPQSQISITTRIGPNMTAGIGMYGPKRDRGQQGQVTGRDLNLPKSRRAGVGISLKF